MSISYNKHLFTKGEQILFSHPPALGVDPRLIKISLPYPFHQVPVSKTSGRIFGQVKDTDGTPLSEVAVKISGKDVGISTDTNGYYSLNADSNEVIEFSHLGFKTLSYVADKVPKVITIVEDAETLDGFTLTPKKNKALVNLGLGLGFLLLGSLLFSGKKTKTKKTRGLKAPVEVTL